jgi:allantoate deiminase
VITTAEIVRRAKEVVSRCQAVARFSEDLPRITRTFLSPSMRACHEEIGGWMRAVGMDVHIDPAGNLRGVYSAGNGSESPRLLIGSHLDSVPDAGAYDGVLGVVLAVSLIEALAWRRLPFALEVVGFSEEEGVRFGVPFIGSRALAGTLDEDLLVRRDSHGITVREAILGYGLDPGDIPLATLRHGVLGFLEFHIEQGPVLDRLQCPLGVVETIAGQTRMELVFTGAAGHAGTTPMALRRDALAAAAEWTVAVEKTATGLPGLVATVGVLEAKPGASNVIAGQCHVTLDVRHASDSAREETVGGLLRTASEIAERRGVQVSSSSILDQAATPMDPVLVSQIETAISCSGLTPHRLVSGAGHDAMVLAGKVPAAMIFVRSPGGISHNPAESVLVDDIAKAIQTGLHLLDQLACSSDFQNRTSTSRA